MCIQSKYMIFFLYYCLRLIKSIILVESNFTKMLLLFFEIKISSSVGYTINEQHVQVGIGDRTLSRKDSIPLSRETVVDKYLPNSLDLTINTVLIVRWSEFGRYLSTTVSLCISQIRSFSNPSTNIYLLASNHLMIV